MNLTVDIGNSRTKLSLFDRGECVAQEACNTLSVDVLSSFLGDNRPDASIICSVSDYNPDIAEWLKHNTGKFIEFTADTPIPITNAYSTPETLGKDRLAAVIGAWTMKPKNPILVIDAGTAITFDFINEEGVYEGGNIAPGAVMRLRALNEHTGKLPLVSLNERRRNRLMGDNTRAAILGGVVEGMVFEIEGYISELSVKNSGLQVFFTGGDAFFFEKYIKSPIFIVSNLTAIGLNAIIEYNL
mgnify:CR=1 FL=1